MTDFAAVSGQTTMPPGAGARSAGKAQGAGAVLSGAFAAIFGKAADGSGTGADGKTAAAPDPAPAALDPALLDGEGAAVPLAGEVADGIDALTGKPRKPGSKAKTAAEQAETLALPVVQAAPAPPLPLDAPAASEGKAKAASAIDAAAAPAAGQEAAARTADESAQTLKALAAESKAVADMLAQAKDGKAAPTTPAPARADAQPAVAGANLAAQLAEQSAPDGAGTGEGSGHGQDRMAALAALATDAPSDDAALTGGFDPLRDIMQSLPPVVQSQVGAARAAGAAPTASTGDLLGDQVIDMSVSGQWIDRMAREIASLADGTGHSRFQLSPPNLGRVQVDLWRGGDSMNVRLTAETDEAARRLREGQSGLENHARIGALSLGSVSVEKASAPFDSGRDQSQRQGADANANAQQQQASAQAQGQSAQGRGNSGAGPNRGGASAVIGSERDGEPGRAARMTRADDPRVRFA